MSGPIIRKYGFPNHDAIFGKRDLEHGVDKDATEKPADVAKDEKAKLEAESKSSEKKS